MQCSKSRCLSDLERADRSIMDLSNRFNIRTASARVRTNKQPPVLAEIRKKFDWILEKRKTHFYIW